MKFKKLILFIVLLNFQNVFSQKLLQLGHYNKESGLINNSVTAIAKDNNGFFWISTREGISRWDGINFVNTNFASLKFSDSSRKVQKNDIFTTLIGGNILTIDSNSQVFNVYHTESTFAANQDNRNFFCSINLTQLKSNSPSELYKTFDSVITKSKPNISYFETREKSYYFKGNFENKLLYIQGDTIKNKLSIDITDAIFFCIDNKLIALSTKTKQYFVIENGSIVNSNFLTKNTALINTNYWYVDQHLSFSIVAIKNYLISFSLSNTNELLPDIKGILPTYYYSTFYYDDKSRKVITGTYNDGISVFGVPLIETKKEKNEKQIIYTQCIVDNKLINNQTIFPKLYDWKTDQFFWHCVGPILQLNTNEILTGSNSCLHLLNNKLQKVKTWLFNNFIIKDFLKTDSVVYFSNTTLNKYYPKSKTIKEYNLNEWPLYGINLNAICPSITPNCIYAAIGNKVYELNLKTQESTLLADNFNIYGEIRSLFYDTSINVLFVSHNNDQCYFIKDKKKYKLPNLQDNTLLKCHYVLTDKDGDYWLPTNNGLYCMLKKDFLAFVNGKTSNINYKRFGKEDGIANEEFNGGFGGAGLVYKDTIYLASMEGTVVFSPTIKYINKEENGKLLVDYITIDDSTYKNTSRFEVAPNYRQILIKTAYPFFYSQNKYIEYRLLGSGDTTWNRVAADGIIVIKKEGAGNYDLQIRVGKNAVNSKIVHFKIKPYWYATWWAFTVLFLIILAIIQIVFLWRVQRLKNINMQQMKQSQDKLFTTIAHDLKSPINNFVNLSDNIRFLIEQKDFETIAVIGNEIDEKGRNINLLVSNILNWSLVQQGLLKLNKEKILLQDILDEIIPAYKDIARFKNINIVSKTQPGLSLVTDANILSTILRNIIDNAIKYSSNNNIITIDSLQKDNVTTLSITNANEFINSKAINEIKAIFNNKMTAQPYNNNLGLGIAIMHQNAALINAQLTIDTVEKNVIFTLSL